MADTGASGLFIDGKYAKEQRIVGIPLKEPLNVYNVDGTLNKQGTITHCARICLTIGERTTWEKFYITGLGRQKIILGLPWFRTHNPNIDWITGRISWKKQNQIRNNPEDEEDLLIHFINGTNEQEAKINASKIHDTQNIVKEEPLKERIPKEYHKWLKLFDKKAADRFPKSKVWDHKIELKPEFKPQRAKIYNLTPEEDRELDKFLREQLEKGYIRKSESEMTSSFFFVGKKDGKLRPCQDYRYLNEWTKKNGYPLPLITELLDKLKGAKLFTKLDVRWGYNNIRIRRGDEWKAAFTTKKGTFEPTVMFFGMCNSPATFQTMMDNIFRKLIDRGQVIVYMDDILIYAKEALELEEITKEVLQILEENDLYLKPEKCFFKQKKIDYLGMIIEEGKIAMDPSKLKGLRDWPTPKTVKQVRSFLGFGNFYRKFIRHYSEIAKPLNNLLRKDQIFKWTNESQKAFELLKKKFTEEPVLKMPDQTKPFQIECDASKYASGAVLTQIDDQGARHPCAFISKTFNEAERNYEIHDRELLALIRALEEWRHYIQGSPFTTTILSDHANLNYFTKKQKLNRRQARWALTLAEYNFELKHTPGHRMIQSDALSRRADLYPENDRDNEDKVLLPENIFIHLIDTELQREIANSEKLDFDAANAIKTLLNSKPGEKMKNLEDWTTQSFEGKNMLFYKGRNYIPDDIKLRRNITKRYHDSITAGHPGELETYNSVREHYWWPGMKRFIKQYVQGCADCQRYKINRNPTNPVLEPIEGSRNLRPFADCSMDLITDLPPTMGYDSILSVVDRGLTKGILTIPCTKNSNAEDIARLLVNNLYKRFGLPDRMLSDRDPRFAAKSFREMMKLLGIESNLTTAYRPQSDGATERFNQEIEAYLSIYCANHPTNWPQALPTLEFTHNNRRHADRIRTPFELMFGTSPLSIPTSFENSKYPDINERLENLTKERQEALAAHELARTRMMERYKSKYKPFKVGQMVMLSTKNLKINLPAKMKPKAEGPFKIIKATGLTYQLEIPKTWKIHDRFHATLLKPYTENKEYGRHFLKPPPDIINEEEEWEVERIESHRKQGKGYKYLIKWKGYPSSENSWEPKSNLANASDILREYHQLRKLPIIQNHQQRRNTNTRNHHAVANSLSLTHARGNREH